MISANVTFFLEMNKRRFKKFKKKHVWVVIFFFSVIWYIIFYEHKKIINRVSGFLHAATEALKI